MDFKLKKSDLNFMVYTASSLPEIGQENDVCIISDVPMKNWTLSPDESKGTPRNDGDVWIQYSVGGNVFDALKDNVMMISFLSVKQYIDGAWVEKTAKSYKNGTWEGWVKYLYYKGNQYTDLTGGWVSYGSSAKITFSSDHIRLEIQSGYNETWAMAHTANKIDITNISKLYFYIDERTSTDITESTNANSKYSTVGISVSPDVRTNGWTAYKRVSTGTTQTLFEVDVSEYNGEYYVCILNAVNASGYMKCSQVYGK